MTIRPTDLPELRAEILSYYKRADTSELWRMMADAGMFVVPGVDGEQLLALEAHRLRRETYWVSADMTDLACAAAPSMPDFTIYEHDLPSLYGFMYFARPIATTEGFSRASSPRIMQVTACSWGPVYDGEGTKGLWVGFYIQSDTAEEMYRHVGYPSMAHARQARSTIPGLMYESEILIKFGDDISAHIAQGLLHDTAGRVVRAAWSLMQQPLAEQRDVEADRASRNRARRAGQDLSPVRVIELRRPVHSGSGDGSREFHHQWIVRGHWRQQWHPKRQVHRPVWIAPHIKGPEGAPLIGGEKVYAWKR